MRPTSRKRWCLSEWMALIWSTRWLTVFLTEGPSMQSLHIAASSRRWKAGVSLQGGGHAGVSHQSQVLSFNIESPGVRQVSVCSQTARGGSSQTARGCRQVSGRSEIQRHLASLGLQAAARVHQVIVGSTRTAAAGLACTATCSPLVVTACKPCALQPSPGQGHLGADRCMLASKVRGQACACRQTRCGATSMW